MLNRQVQTNIYIKQGSNFNLTVTMNDSAGAARDLTSYTGKSEIRVSRDATTIAQAITVTIPSPTNGQVLMALTAVQTLALDFENNDYVYDLLLKDGSNNVETAIEGKAILVKDITEF